MVPQTSPNVNVATSSATEHVSSGNTEVVPDASWSLDQLAQYVKDGLRASDDAEIEVGRLEERLHFVRRTSVLSYFRSGRALFIVRERLKQKQEWCNWMKTHELSRKTVLVAINIYQKGKTEELVSEHTLAEAKLKWCVGTRAGGRRNKIHKDSQISHAETSPTDSQQDARKESEPPASDTTVTQIDPIGVLDGVIRELRRLQVVVVAPQQCDEVSRHLMTILSLVAEIEHGMSGNNTKDQTVIVGGYALPPVVPSH